jgi:2-oxoglutarate ferredoxin oxidoreductase subunit beta
VVHDENGPAAYAFMLAQMEQPNFPLPVGVFRRNPQQSFDEATAAQIAAVTAKLGEGDLEKLIYSGETWDVK